MRDADGNPSSPAIFSLRPTLSQKARKGWGNLRGSRVGGIRVNTGYPVFTSTARKRTLDR